MYPFWLFNNFPESKKADKPTESGGNCFLIFTFLVVIVVFGAFLLLEFLKLLLIRG